MCVFSSADLKLRYSLDSDCNWSRDLTVYNERGGCGVGGCRTGQIELADVQAHQPAGHSSVY